MLAFLTFINRCFEIDTLSSFHGICDQPLQQMRFDWIFGFCLAELEGTNEAIFEISVFPLDVECNIVRRQFHPKRLNEVSIEQIARSTYDTDE